MLRHCRCWRTECPCTSSSTRYEGTPVAVLQTSSRPQYGRGDAAIEVLAPDEVAQRLIADVRRLSLEHNGFRGQVLTLGSGNDAYNPTVGGITFHPRPRLPASAVVLPEGVLERIERHVLGTAVHRDALRAAGQHLKRGLLLYGPPGTGKTHTVRYLLGRLDGVAVVLLSGTSLGLVGEATEMARALEPAVVVLEDVDLVALDRSLHEGPQPLLFTVMEAMDELEGDSDVAFVLTTNRADLLEHALAQRPGRVDLAVEVPPLPDGPDRRRLAALYSQQLGFTTDGLDEVATRTEGATASLFKELMRRAVLVAAEHGRAAADTASRWPLTSCSTNGSGSRDHSSGRRLPQARRHDRPVRQHPAPVCCLSSLTPTGQEGGAVDVGPDAGQG